MTLLPLFRWIDASFLAEYIRESSYIFPVIEVVHLLGLVALLGSLVVVDLRLLGICLRRQSVTRVAREFGPVMHAGLITMLVTGLLLFASEAMKCYGNDAFWMKMGFLFPAITVYLTIHRKTLASDQDKPVWNRVTVCLSLILWFGVGLGGRGIAFV